MSTMTLHNEKKKTLVPKLRFQEFTNEWKSKKLENWNLKVIDGDRGANYPNGNDFSFEGYCLFMNAKNVTKNGFSFETKMFITKEKDEKLRKGKLKRNDLVLTTRGSVGNIAYYNNSIKYDHLRINSGMVLIRNENSLIDSNFLYISFVTPKLNKIIDTIAFGSAQPQLTVKEINLFKISIPTLPEQQKIASFLSAVDEKIQQLSRKKIILEQYKKGIMQQLFSGKLRFKNENGEDYPDWEEKKLGDVLKIGSGKDYKHLENGTIPVFGTGGYMLSVNKYLHNGETVFIGRKGTIDKPFYFDGKFWTVDTLFYTHSFKNTTPKFIYCVFQQINWKLHNEASGVPSLSKSTIEKLKFDFPCISEQQKIAAFLSSIDTKIESVNQQIAQTQTFKKGLLQQMFV
ncbi:restriction endonuclease subunit S [Flavobacterium sp. WG21]|uniref:restriction endonuclease subunit S n=1 Tax=Flavobacterium sp. WG21 TaxID=1229487 RepID=UPI00034CDF0C|nr:restriction endonuclease subunit S [Flavobacterium sp. WG21]